MTKEGNEHNYVHVVWHLICLTLNCFLHDIPWCKQWGQVGNQVNGTTVHSSLNMYKHVRTTSKQQGQLHHTHTHTHVHISIHSIQWHIYSVVFLFFEKKGGRESIAKCGGTAWGRRRKRKRKKTGRGGGGAAAVGFAGGWGGGGAVKIPLQQLRHDTSQNKTLYKNSF